MEETLTPFGYIYASIVRRPFIASIEVVFLTIASILFLLALSFTLGTGPVGEKVPSTIWSETPVIPIVNEMGVNKEMDPLAQNALITIFYISSILSLAMGYLLIRSAESIFLKERLSEIAILKALGFSRVEIKKLILGEGLVLGFISSIISIFIAMPIFVNLGAYMIKKGEKNLFFVQPQTSPISIVILILTIVGITTLAQMGALRSVEKETGRIL